MSYNPDQYTEPQQGLEPNKEKGGNAMFTRQHYKAIAKIVDGKTCVQFLSNNPFDYLSKNQLVDALADMFQDDNPNFNREKFTKACGRYPVVS